MLGVSILYILVELIDGNGFGKFLLIIIYKYKMFGFSA